MDTEPPQQFYRYVDTRTSNGVTVVCYTYNLGKETPKGYWIGSCNGPFNTWYTKIWVSKTARKRYAYPDKEQARVSFRERKARQVKILQAQLTRALAAAKLAMNSDCEGRSHFIYSEPLSSSWE